MEDSYFVLLPATDIFVLNPNFKKLEKEKKITIEEFENRQIWGASKSLYFTQPASPSIFSNYNINDTNI